MPVLTGFPSFPDETLDPKLYNSLVAIHNGIKNLDAEMSLRLGIDPYPSSEWSSLGNTGAMTITDGTRMYVKAGTNITAGQIVTLYVSSGEVRARLADAGTFGEIACGVANQSALTGTLFEIQWMRGIVTSIGGLLPGAYYYLSTTPGSIQDFVPTASSTYQQAIGFAVGTSKLIMEISLLQIFNP